MTQDERKKRDGKDHRRAIAVIVGSSLLIAGTFGASAIAESRIFQHAKTFVSDGNFVQNAHWGGRRGGGGWSKLSDAEVESRIARVVKHVAIEIDATDEQSEKITKLLAAVANDMRPLRDDFREAGQKMRGLLLTDAVDRAALEELRKQRVAVVEQRSKQLVDALADVAEVLTPKQRATLDARIEEFRGMRKRWRRG